MTYYTVICDIYKTKQARILEQNLQKLYWFLLHETEEAFRDGDGKNGTTPSRELETIIRKKNKIHNWESVKHKS